jgi:hypothetical protein
MKRIVIRLLFLMLLLAMGEISTANAALPSTPDKTLPKITIQLPKSNKDYNVTDVAYSIIVEKPSSWFDHGTISGQLFSASFYLDNGTKVTLAILSSPEEFYNKQPAHFQGTLSGLSDGNHSLEVYVDGVTYYKDLPQAQVESNYYLNTSQIIYFNLDTTPPKLSMLSIENKNYASEIPLDFNINEPASSISYCLDNTNNMTISGNVTLNGLAAGEHKLVLYAWDYAGNVGASETIRFSVVDPEPHPPEISPVGFILLVIFLIVAFCVSAIYLRRHKSS